MKKYVKIQSSINVQVTGGLDGIDVTDKNSNVSNKLKVQPLWTKERVVIKAGVGWYPAKVTNWASTKSLEKHKIITIGEYAESLPNDVSEADKSALDELEKNLKIAELEKEKKRKMAAVKLSAIKTE
jgi:hypothetical protein